MHSMMLLLLCHYDVIMYIAPVIEYENNPEIRPVAQTDDNREPSGVTSTSFAIEFQIVPEQEVNGMVDK